MIGLRKGDVINKCRNQRTYVHMSDQIVLYLRYSLLFFTPQMKEAKEAGDHAGGAANSSEASQEAKHAQNALSPESEYTSRTASLGSS